MPRKGHIAKRDVLVDPIYNSKLVTRLINKIMIDGKKGVANRRSKNRKSTNGGFRTSFRKCYASIGIES